MSEEKIVTFPYEPPFTFIDNYGRCEIQDRNRKVVIPNMFYNGSRTHVASQRIVGSIVCELLNMQFGGVLDPVKPPPPNVPKPAPEQSVKPKRGRPAKNG